MIEITGKDTNIILQCNCEVRIYLEKRKMFVSECLAILNGVM